MHHCNTQKKILLSIWYVEFGYKFNGWTLDHKIKKLASNLGIATIYFTEMTQYESCDYHSLLFWREKYEAQTSLRKNFFLFTGISE